MKLDFCLVLVDKASINETKHENWIKIFSQSSNQLTRAHVTIPVQQFILLLSVKFIRNRQSVANKDKSSTLQFHRAKRFRKLKSTSSTECHSYKIALLITLQQVARIQFGILVSDDNDLPADTFRSGNMNQKWPFSKLCRSLNPLHLIELL